MFLKVWQAFSYFPIQVDRSWSSMSEIAQRR